MYVCILSSPDSTSSRSTAWPIAFPLPRFAYDTQLQLDRANAAFKETGALLNPNTKLKSAILDGLAETIVKYKVYLSDREFDEVAEALVTTSMFKRARFSDWVWRMEDKPEV